MDKTYEHISVEAAQLILDELHRNVNAIRDSRRALDEKATSLFGWASLLTGFVSAFGLPSLGQADSVSAAYCYVLLGGLLLYAVIALIVLCAIHPQAVHLSIEPCWKTEYDMLLSKGEKIAILRLIATYNDTISHNRDVVMRKGRGLLVGQILMALLVGLLFALAMSPLWAL